MLALTVTHPITLRIFGDPDLGARLQRLPGAVPARRRVDLAGAGGLGAHRQPDRRRHRLARAVPLMWMLDSLGSLLPDPYDTVVINLSLLAHFTPFATGALYLSDLGFFATLDPARAAAQRSGAGATLSSGSRQLARQSDLVPRLARRGRSCCSGSPCACRCRPGSAPVARGSMQRAVVVLIFVVAVLANVALALHDAQIDLTREKVFTPSEQALAVVDASTSRSSSPISSRDRIPTAGAPRTSWRAMARRNPLLEVATVDPDKEPTLAENFGVKVYNAAVLEADGRRITGALGRRERDRDRHPAGAARAGGHRVLHRGAQRVPDRQLRVPYALRRGGGTQPRPVGFGGRS